MKTNISFLVVITLLSISQYGCSAKKQNNKLALKAEIYKTEKEFEKTVLEKGFRTGFSQFSDANAVLIREHDTLIKGKNEILNYYLNPKFKNASVQWTPDFIDISEDGTMGYTFGKYTWTVKDSLGKSTNYNGIFHTVWKKQNDGTWKYVWD